ncbi:vanin-like protein 1 isoform X2 [Pseudomyrmex gracilis]|nr:vanin-like protein 1 isoform X2 [Pseudomyrmex gracilis]XP_020291103.1 vanin-like protein 1 isoform X2 [Pseudomyrmex gracilis]XP_020291104.1 vanin-like protein 1 isoform X2 [Pseudomyrmex gracilis]XP_020291105.1 vanin-like protein 1 isoform X2 [Pseudomyrmex gracilis]XP_020291106.1 vanin-like protein 1 isoform X2 [Pseudomyrmex gracilis]XP_020291107.1 vanin-like protein 1 isoform X2 [Pseudomyrmex gracilis]XP_020291108.1 vanin-like protein 1 isoform X2 [Pseudomyrmex gracilis]XP_020291109.1 van
MRQQWIIICLLAYVHLSHQKSSPNLPTYVAAVIEYHSEFHIDSESTLGANTDAYVKLIETASAQKVDILVFPEDGLTSYTTIGRHELYNWTTIIPAASDNFIPCTNTTINVSKTLREISCAARENEIYVVINIAEQLPCVHQPGCRKDNMFYYNSNVVFDRKGKIIARYRKTNLFMEHNFDTTKEPEVVIFDTDFGVKFGTFTCFDILFYNPALQLTRHQHITDIVFPTAWFSEVPFLTAVQTQAGWSFAEDVNFLVSGYNRPFSGSTGSGIYLGRKGVGKAIMSRINETEMLIFEVPKIKRTNESESYQNHMKDNNQQTKSYKEESTFYELRNKQENTITKTNNTNIFFGHDFIDHFETFLFQQQNISQKSLCQNSFCCEFTVSTVLTDPNIKYRLVVFSGTRKYGVTDASVSTCGIIQCLNETIASCVSIPRDSKTVFSEMEVTARFEDYKNILIMPSTLSSDLLPLTKWAYDEHTHDNHVHVTISLNNNINNVVTFGLYARTFHEGKNGAACAFNTISGFVLSLAVLLLSRLI